MATANLLQTSVSGGTQNALSLQGDGVFFPKASTTSRLALTLTTTDKGFIVYDTTDNNIYFWNGTAWESVPSSGDAGANGSVQYNDNGIVSGATNFVYTKATGAVAITGAATATLSVGTATADIFARFYTRSIGFDSSGSTVLQINGASYGGLDLGAAGVRTFSLTSSATDPNISTVTNIPLIFNINNSEAMRLNSTSNLVLRGGTANANGVGVTFPATQSASSDANCLDDYEEGTWVPSVGGDATYTLRRANYVKVGRLVTVSWDMEILLIGTGDVSGIISLPFVVGTASGLNNQPGYGACGFFNVLATTVYSMTFYAAANTSTIYAMTKNSLSAGNSVNTAIYGNGSRVQGSLTYMTNS